MYIHNAVPPLPLVTVGRIRRQSCPSEYDFQKRLSLKKKKELWHQGTSMIFYRATMSIIKGS